MFHVPEKYRYKEPGEFYSDESYGNNGLFFIPCPVFKGNGSIFFLIPSPPLKIIASDGEGWEHVSVSLQNRIPSWEEMCYVKNIFWDEEDCVIQYHPPKSWYKNCCRFCLHMWKPLKEKIPMPPLDMV